MILKDLHGKLGRFLHGRLRALADSETNCIPPSCLHYYQGQNNLSAIFYSGDGGWAKLTTQVSECLQQNGVSVHGIDCMHYFWKEKTPDHAALDLSNLVHNFCDPAQRLVLIGYSMGADVLPAISARLPKEILNRVDHLILMSPSHRALLKFRFIGWLGFATPTHLGHALLPDLKALSNLPITCIAGEKEHDSLLSENLAGIASTLRLPGGHHYSSDYKRLSQEILSIINPSAN